MRRKSGDRTAKKRPLTAAETAAKKLNRLVGERMRDARERAGISRIEFAPVLGLSEGSSLYKWEVVGRAFSPYQIVCAAQKLGVSCNWLLTGHEQIGQAGSSVVQPVQSSEQGDVETLHPVVVELLLSGLLGKCDADDLAVMRAEASKGSKRGDDHDVLLHNIEMEVRIQRVRRDPSEANVKALTDTASQGPARLHYSTSSADGPTATTTSEPRAKRRRA